MIHAGDVLLHKDFQFHDGGKGDKYLVVLAHCAECVLVAKTTSNGARHRNDHGCQAGERFPAFLLTAGCCFFPKPTWICIDEFYELHHAEVANKLRGGVVFRAGKLNDDLTRDLQSCVAGCDDISESQEKLVRACFVAA